MASPPVLSMLLDYYAKNLLPAVWSSDGTLSLRFRAQLDEQLKRFPDASPYLIGDAVNHYWQHDSDVDVVLMVEPDIVVPYRQQAKNVNDFHLVDSDCALRFWIMPNTTTPSVLAKHFGPLYCLVTSQYFGIVTPNETDLTDPASLVCAIDWQLYKAKFDVELFPENWRLVAEAFREMGPANRTILLDMVRYRLAAVDRNVNKVLTAQPSEYWRRVEELEKILIDTEELPDVQTKLPRRVVLAILHRFRYQDLLDSLIEIDDRLRQYTRQASMQTEKVIRVHGTVMVEGSRTGLLEAKRHLRRHYRCHHYRDNAMTVEEVAEPEMATLTRIAKDNGLHVTQVRGTHEVHLATDEPTKKMVKLDLLAGSWYRTNQESFPLVHVTQVWNQMSPEGEEMWLFDVDLVASGTLPMPATMTAEQLSEYKPKPATVEDFDALDIAPPAGFSPSPHSIPEPEDNPAEQKVAGVSLPQAQLACLALKKRLGYRVRNATTERLPAGGFCIVADVCGQGEDPIEIVGTTVRYR